VYGSLVADARSRFEGLAGATLGAFRPTTSPPDTASVLRSILWPIAILSVIHRTYVLATNGYITDDFGPVYRAVSNLRLGLDIYNEHFDYVDPHYLYPPGGTLLLSPFGFLPEFASRNWYFTLNSLATLVAAYFMLRLFNYTLASVAAPALVLAMYCTESVTNTLVFTNINGFILLAEVLFFRWLLDGRRNREWLAGVAIGLTLVVKPSLAPLLLLPLLNRQWRALVPAFGVPLVFNIAAWPLVSDPMSFVRNTVPYILGTRDYFNSSIEGNGIYYGLPPLLILALRLLFALLAVGSLVLLYRHYRTRDPRFWLVPGPVAGAGLLLDDAVPVPDDRGAAELGAAQLAGVAGGVRLHDHGPVADVALAVDRTLPRVHEDHLWLVADAGRGVRGALLPLPRRQGRRTPRGRHRSAVADARTPAR
jgi:arabinofuranan 3-O-arabinosyltransferase